MPALVPVAQCRTEGTCGGRCGGGSDLDCWCDELCLQHGDCCCDRETLCSGSDNHQEDFLLSPGDLTCSSAGTCAGRCQDGSDQDCWCDDHCQDHGGCCCDREQFCVSQVNITTSLVDITTTPTLRLITTDLVSLQDTNTAGPVFMVSSATKTKAVSPSSTSSPVTVLIQSSGTSLAEEES